MKSTQHNCKNELNTVALRATPARIAILQLLEIVQKPLDAITIMEYLEKKAIPTDPVTVYRIMSMFIQKGLVTPIQFHEGKTRYELASKGDHHHLMCENCGRIEDIEDMVIPAVQKQIEKKHHFLVKKHSLEFFGLCFHCQK